jgi:hypothetical protein
VKMFSQWAHLVRTGHFHPKSLTYGDLVNKFSNLDYLSARREAYPFLALSVQCRVTAEIKFALLSAGEGRRVLPHLCSIGRRARRMGDALLFVRRRSIGF